MKQLLVFLLVVAAALAGWFGRDFIPKHDAEAKKEEPAAHSGIEIEDGVIKLGSEMAERLGLETSELKAVTHQPASEAMGRVLDPATLIALDQEITAALAAVEISKAEADRATALFNQGESVPKKNVVTAEAQYRTDQIKLDALRSKLPVEWGPQIAKLDDPARHALIAKLGTRTAAIIRLESLQPLTGIPQSAQITSLADGTTFESKTLEVAPTINERTQAPAFFVVCDKPLAPGTAVSARLDLPGKASETVLIPVSAIVRQGPQAWVYAEKEEHEFTRLPVTRTDHVAEGWLIVPNETLKSGAKILTTGAAALLSAELTAAGAGGGEEP